MFEQLVDSIPLIVISAIVETNISLARRIDLSAQNLKQNPRNLKTSRPTGSIGGAEWQCLE